MTQINCLICLKRWTYDINLVKSVNFRFFYFYSKITFFDFNLITNTPIKFKKDINMTEIIEILKYTIPAVIVFFTSFLLIRMYLRNEEKRRRYEIARDTKGNILPLRLQAYERLILFLERISPESLVSRLSREDLNVNQMLAELISGVRTEFEHNLVQQTYISSQAWESVKAAKNGMIRLVSESAKELKPSANGMLLCRQILENASEMDNLPIYGAIEYLKKEVRELF